MASLLMKALGGDGPGGGTPDAVKLTIQNLTTVGPLLPSHDLQAVLSASYAVDQERRKVAEQQKEFKEKQAALEEQVKELLKEKQAALEEKVNELLKEKQAALAGQSQKEVQHSEMARMVMRLELEEELKAKRKTEEEERKKEEEERVAQRKRDEDEKERHQMALTLQRLQLQDEARRAAEAQYLGAYGTRRVMRWTLGGSSRSSSSSVGEGGPGDASWQGSSSSFSSRQGGAASGQGLTPVRHGLGGQVGSVSQTVGDHVDRSQLSCNPYVSSPLYHQEGNNNIYNQPVYTSIPPPTAAGLGSGDVYPPLSPYLNPDEPY